MKERFSRNPRARGMSYENRLKRYYQDREEFLIKNMGAPAEKIQAECERLLRWWNL